jgi:hypothetical protein
MTDREDKINEFISAVEGKIRQELRKRCEALKPDFSSPEVFTVLLALLARQATLAIELARAPQLWNGHSSPLFLRAMADLHITFSWIAVKPEQRAKQYLEYGLGQAVLILDHHKANLDNIAKDKKEQMQKSIETEESWINAQKLAFMIEVNVGAWSGKNTRDMAKEAGISDFYNNVYIPFSQCAHNTWFHVGRYNSLPSDSPLNSLLWKPNIYDQAPDVWELHLVAKYLDKTFNEYDERILKQGKSSGIRNWIYQEIQTRFSGETNDNE